MEIINNSNMQIINEKEKKNVTFTIKHTSTKNDTRKDHPDIEINIDSLDEEIPEDMYNLPEIIMDNGIPTYPKKTAAEWIRDKKDILTELSGTGDKISTFTVDTKSPIIIEGYTQDEVYKLLTPPKTPPTAPNKNKAEIIETTSIKQSQTLKPQQGIFVPRTNRPQPSMQNSINKLFTRYSSIIISYVFIIGIIVIITEKYHTEQRSTLMRNSLRLENNEIFYETYTYLPILIFVYTILIITFIYFLMFSVYIIFKLDSNSVENPFIMDNNDEFKLFDYNILIQIMFISIIMFFLNLILIPASFSFVKNYKKVTDKLGNKIISEKTINEFQLYYKTFFYVVYGIVLIAVFLVYNYLK